MILPIIFLKIGTSEIYHLDCEQKVSNCFIKKPLAIYELVKQINSILE